MRLTGDETRISIRQGNRDRTSNWSSPVLSARTSTPTSSSPYTRRRVHLRRRPWRTWRFRVDLVQDRPQNLNPWRKRILVVINRAAQQSREGVGFEVG